MAASGTWSRNVAVIGTDTFVREGAGVGIMFQAKNNFLFSSSISQQRAEALKALGAKEETLVIDCQQYCLDHLVCRLYDLEPEGTAHAANDLVASRRASS